jgi:hypothetical protein
VARSTAVLSHRKPASARGSCDTVLRDTIKGTAHTTLQRFVTRIKLSSLLLLLHHKKLHLAGLQPKLPLRTSALRNFLHSHTEHVEPKRRQSRANEHKSVTLIPYASSDNLIKLRHTSHQLNRDECTSVVSYVKTRLSDATEQQMNNYNLILPSPCIF